MQTEKKSVTPAEETNRTKLRVALHAFYQKHNQSMLNHIDVVVADHEGKLPLLNQKLRAKYATDLSDIGAYCSLSGSH